MNRLLPLLLILGLAAGAFVGRLLAHQVGGPFALPQRPDPQQWRVISPGLEEGIGRSGAGRVTHVVDGALSIATHVFFRPDMVVPQFSGDAHVVDVELAPDSGTLLIQIGEPHVQAIQVRPHAYRANVSGASWIPSPGVHRFQLREQDGRLVLVAGTQSVDVGIFVSGRLELSSQEEWARITRLSISDGTGAAIFSSDFRKHGPSRLVLDQATVVGAVLGFVLVFLLSPWSGRAALTCLVGLLPPVLVLGLPRDVWLHGVERLYLSRVPPSDLAIFTLLCSLSFLVFLALLKMVRLVSLRWTPARQGFWAWLVVALCASLVAQTLHGGSLFAWVLIWFCMGAGAIDGFRRAPPVWWVVDAIAWIFIALIGPDKAAVLVVVWRLISVLGTVSLWIPAAPRVAVLMLMIAGLSLPPAAEAWVRTTPLRDAWQTNRLSGERPNEKGWEEPAAGWTGQCGGSDASRTVSVVVAGGSSVGGAYQFGGEPEAFFTAIAHGALCAQIPDNVRLRTHNFGDGDRNTFTISRTIDEHLAPADILVLYVGVNDVFTTQNTMTRKDREARSKGLFARLSWLPGWFRESRLAVGLSLWFRALPDLNQAQVADVPLPDARDNHQIIIDAAQKSGIQVLLMTEYVRSAQRSRLQPYAQMQQSMTNESVRWIDVQSAFSDMSDSAALVDSNHLSREGNAQLGRYLASELKDWVYGSSR